MGFATLNPSDARAISALRVPDALRHAVPLRRAGTPVRALATLLLLDK
jgi:hypothetical protein